MSAFENSRPYSFTMPLNTFNDYEFLVPSDNIFHTYYDTLSSLFLPFSSRSMDRVLAGLAMIPTFTDYLRPALVTIFALSIPFIFNYVATWLFFQITHWSKEAAKIPPTIPHLIPFIGSSFDLGFNALNFVKSSTYVHITLLKSQRAACIYELISYQRATRKADTVPRCSAESQRLLRARLRKHRVAMEEIWNNDGNAPASILPQISLWHAIRGSQNV